MFICHAFHNISFALTFLFKFFLIIYFYCFAPFTRQVYFLSPALHKHLIHPTIIPFVGTDVHRKHAVSIQISALFDHRIACYRPFDRRLPKQFSWTGFHFKKITNHRNHDVYISYSYLLALHTCPVSLLWRIPQQKDFWFIVKHCSPNCLSVGVDHKTFGISSDVWGLFINEVTTPLPPHHTSKWPIFVWIVTFCLTPLDCDVICEQHLTFDYSL